MMKWLIKKLWYDTYLKIQKEAVDEFLKYVCRKPKMNHVLSTEYGETFVIEVRKVVKNEEG